MPSAFPGPHQVVERSQRLLQRGQRVESVELIQVDVVGAEPLEAGLAAADDVVTGLADVVRAVAHPAVNLGRQDHPVAASLQGLAEDLLRRPLRVDIGGVEQVDARLQAEIDESARLVRLDRSHLLLVTRAAERHRAEGERGHLKSAGA
jgi:hypothetical protein